MNNLIQIAIRSELLHRHAAMLTLSGNRDTRFNGYNHYSNSRYSMSIHAECDAINRCIFYYQMRKYTPQKIRRKMKKMGIIIVRLSTHSDSCLRNSAPCIDCLLRIKEYGISKIGFSSNDGSFCYQKTRQLNNGITTSGNKKFNTF
jgi:hypothetical protein